MYPGLREHKEFLLQLQKRKHCLFSPEYFRVRKPETGSISSHNPPAIGVHQFSQGENSRLEFTLSSPYPGKTSSLTIGLLDSSVAV